MYQSRAQSIKSLSETNYCLSVTENDVNIKISLSSLASPLGSFLFLTSHPPWSGQLLSSHISFSFVFSANLPNTQLSPEGEDGKEDNPCLTLNVTDSKRKHRQHHKPTFSLYPAWVTVLQIVAILRQEMPLCFCSTQHHQAPDLKKKKKITSFWDCCREEDRRCQGELARDPNGAGQAALAGLLGKLLPQPHHPAQSPWLPPYPAHLPGMAPQEMTTEIGAHAIHQA